MLIVYKDLFIILQDYMFKLNLLLLSKSMYVSYSMMFIRERENRFEFYCKFQRHDTMNLWRFKFKE